MESARVCFGWREVDFIVWWDGKTSILISWPPLLTHEDLTKITGAPPAINGPQGYATVRGGSYQDQHVLYVSSDRHIQELYLDQSSKWGHVDLTLITGAPVVSNGFSANENHVVYCTEDGHVHELCWDESWGHVDLTQITGAPPATGSPHAYRVDDHYVGSKPTQHVVYRSADSHVHELYWDESSGWGHVDLTQITGAPLAAGSPHGYHVVGCQVMTSLSQHVVYRSEDGHIQELYWDGSSGWGHVDLTQITGAPLAAGPPFGYDEQGYLFENKAPSTQHVVYRSEDGHIQELYWDESSGWSHADLTQITGALVAIGNPMGCDQNRGSGHRHMVVYIGQENDGSGRICTLLWDNDRWKWTGCGHIQDI